jgi:Domain of unknown function (DUF4373)
MARHTVNYFPHDSNARSSEKLIKVRMRHGAAGYGVFFMLLERLRDEPEYMSVKDYNCIAFDLRVDASLVKSVIEDFGLFAITEDGKCFYSESLKQRMEIKDEIRQKKIEAGRKGAETKAKARGKQKVSKCLADAAENGSKNQAKNEGLGKKQPKNGVESGDSSICYPKQQAYAYQNCSKGLADATKIGSKESKERVCQNSTLMHPLLLLSS